MPRPKNPNPRPRRPLRQPHPWDDWFARLEWADDVLELHAPADFTCTQASLIKQFQREAAARGRRVRARAYSPSPFHYAVRIVPVTRGDAYPWDRWLDGQPHALVQGADFPKSLPISGFASQVRTAARRRGQTVRTAVRGPQVFIQATSPAEADTLVPAVADALAGLAPGSGHSLGDLEQLVAHLDPAPRARRLAGIIKELGWHQTRTATTRTWVAPHSNALESGPVG